MKYLISIEGQTIELPEEIAGDDAKLKAALSPFFPGAANAKIMRNPEKEGVINITVIKQAGTKGAGHLAKLIKARESTNPVVELHQEVTTATVNQLPAEQLMRLDARIEKVVSEGEKQHQAINRTRDLLMEADPKPSLVVPAGF